MQTLNAKLTIDKSLIESPNLCSRFDDEDLTTIGSWAYEGYERDKQSRMRWERRMEAGMDLAMQIQKDKNYPWPGAANVIFPLITIAALQFSARSYSNIVQGTDVVRYRVLGADSEGELRNRADRISKHMSWQVLEEDCSWEEQHDRLLINLGIVGTNFIKTYYSAALGHNVSELVMARDMVLDYYAKSVESASRKTHRIPLSRNDIYERVKSKIFRDVLDEQWFTNLPPQQPTSQDHDDRLGVTISPTDQLTPFSGLEQHCLMDLDQDGYSEPYIVTIEETSHKVLRIVSRIAREEDVERTPDGAILRIRGEEYFTKYTFIPAPDGGIYDVGFGVLLGPLNEAVNTGINQLLDAGTMANLGGGFLGRGAKIRGGAYTVAPGEWKRIDSTGDDIRKSMVPLPAVEPSNVMFQLLGLLIEYTDRIAGTVDQMVGVSPGQNTPAETSRNTTEQGMQVFNMIFKRVWRSMKEEFKKLYKLNMVYMDATKHYGADDSVARQSDYLMNPDLVAPVADPNITSSGLRMTQAMIVREAAHQVPGYDIPIVEKMFLRSMRVEGIDEIYKGPDKVPPLPNPKMQVEQIKAEIAKMKLDHDKQMFIAEQMANLKKQRAEIHLLEAQVAEILSTIQNEKIALKLDAFDKIIDAMKDRTEMLTQSIETMAQFGGQGDGADSGGKGVQPVAAGSGNKAVSNGAAQVG
jgi:chaperonin GroES